MVFSVFDIKTSDPKIQREIALLKVSYDKLVNKSERMKKTNSRRKCKLKFCRNLKKTGWVVYIAEIGYFMFFFIRTLSL